MKLEDLSISLSARNIVAVVTALVLGTAAVVMYASEMANDIEEVKTKSEDQEERIEKLLEATENMKDVQQKAQIQFVELMAELKAKEVVDD